MTDWHLRWFMNAVLKTEKLGVLTQTVEKKQIQLF